jgi:nicotinamidase-related amidase
MANSDSKHRKLSVPLTLEEFIVPEKTALVMWDMQKGLAGRAVNIDRIKVAAARLIQAADEAGVLDIWSRHILPPLDLTVGPFLLFLMKKQQVDHPAKLKPFMQEGMEEVDFLPGFTPAPHHIVLEKSMPSLFVDTPLDLRLKARGIATIVLAGVATDIGLEFTARHALASGYYSVIAEDAAGAYTEQAHEHSIAFLRRWTPVVSTDEICRIWSARQARSL